MKRCIFLFLVSLALSGCAFRVATSADAALPLATLPPSSPETPQSALPEETNLPEPTAIPETTLAPETTDVPDTSAAPDTEAPAWKIEEIDGVTYVEGILIVNKTYSLPAEYPQKSLTTETLNAFWRMKQAAEKDGVTLRCISDYRSYYDQRYIYNGYVDRDGQEAADRYSARPGHSEHQSGLALDLNSTAFDFDTTPEAQWIAAHCAEYGFVIRYPKGKEEITGYLYEPWHIRYVGTDLAAKLLQEDGQFLTLEEYFGLSSAYE